MTGARVDDAPRVELSHAAFARKLQEALEAELHARDYYQVAARALPRETHFAQLARAEQRHANAVASGLRRIGTEPALKQGRTIVAPRTLAEAKAHGRKIEARVIALYKELIRDCPASSGVARMLTNLQRANYRHLSSLGG